MAIENFTAPQMCSYTTLWFIVITSLVWECRLFSDIDVLQGNVARLVRYGGIDHFIAHFLENLSPRVGSGAV